MCAGRENTCVGNKKGNQVCVPAEKTHAQETKKEIRYVCRQGKHMRRKRKTKSGMYASRENTCVESEKRNQVCMPAGKTHAQEAKNEIRYVCRQRKHMRRKRKTKSGMCAGMENTCVENKKGNQVCMPAGKTHAQKAKKEIRYVCRQRKHMRRKQKRKLGMYGSRENTCVETKKRNQVCKEQK